MASRIQNLELFVHAALEKGVPKSEIEQCLLQVGWPADQIKNALNQFADIAFAVPVPKRRPYLSAREAFLYLLLFTTLYLSAYYLGSMLFDFVNLNFPDPVMNESSFRIHKDIRLAASFLVIACPVFLFMSRRIYRELADNPDKRLSAVRRWLTYLTLLVAACFVIGDLVTLVYNALGGELTTRFCLKVLIVGVIAGTIFWFYLWDLGDEEREAPSMNRQTVMKRLAVTISAVVVVSLIGSVYVIDSPTERRQLRLDERRLHDLAEINRTIQRYAKKHNSLPQDLATLEAEATTEAGTNRPPTDPDTSTPYEYQALDAETFQLCAVFSRPSPDDDRPYYESHWRTHTAGKQCFEYTLDTKTRPVAIE
ncbi:MAG: DUF5671 domain-containing protein [Betaproteobacteria bacterium]|nr:DUF5671 domain-containing protein [Betaproteobacteria bacterium]